MPTRAIHFNADKALKPQSLPLAAALSATAATAAPPVAVVPAALPMPPQGVGNNPSAYTSNASGPETTAAEKAKAEIALAKVIDKILYRCMYAGFVIKSGKCVAPQELPWNLSGVDAKNFKCTNGTVMCNPFVFGVDVTKCDWKAAKDKPEEIKKCLETSKPFCTPRDRFATKNCSSLSNTDAAAETAVYLIRDGEENKKAFNEFSQNFSDLCDENMIDYNNYGRKNLGKAAKAVIAKEISRTCKAARTRLLAVKEKYNIINSAGKAAEASKPAIAPAPRPAAGSAK
jgi:hypothetical protein